MTDQSHRLTVFADYFQFVLMDERSDDDFSTLWTEEALTRMLAVGTYAVCPGTLRNVDVAVHLHIVESRPAVNLVSVDHAAEGSLAIPSGRLVIMGCTGYLPEAPRIEVEPGVYQLLYAVSGVNTITAEWEPANDLYAIYLWPGIEIKPTLLKHWKETVVQQPHAADAAAPRG